MLKIALAQLNYQVGNFEQNTAKIIGKIKEAELNGVDIVVFSELSVCGYPARDFLTYPHFVEQCQQAIQKIATTCTTTAAIIGAPTKNPKLAGKNIFNSALFLSNGKIQQVVNKSLLPTYDVFDEYRYFESAANFSIVTYKGYKIAVTVCEDLWDVDNDKMYKYSPMDALIKQEPQLMINIAASPFDYKHRESRIKVFTENCKKYQLPLFYTNQIGAQTELVFDGGSMVLNKNGDVLDELNYFEEDIRYYTFENGKIDVANGTNTDVIHSKNERIYNALVLGIKDYFAKLGFKKAILGLSGGIDSALVAALAVQALGKENVKGILMPSQFSSDHSIADAVKLAKKLGIEYEILSIEKSVVAFTQTLEKSFEGTVFNVAEENIQARCRGILLMAQSNKFGYVLLNTTNKSEAAVGYGTLYGDMCGGLAVLGDVYKTEIYELASFINKNEEIIPVNTITKAPSAELRPNQKDTDSLPDYDILDKVLYNYIEQCLGPEEIIDLGFDDVLVKRVLRLVNMNEYKRFQMAPVLRVSPKAFGMGRRMPLEGKYLN